ncbi:MAG: radical SAM protein [Phycisphaera sp.]|nr:radical SAM protein [Phycisphaera sp.]
MNLRDIDIESVIAGSSRLSVEQALTLYHQAPLTDLGRWSSAVAQRIHGSTHRTYVIDRNVNYTNVCSARCTFCAFRRDEDEHDAYTLTRQQLHDKVRELVDIGGTQVLLQGGMHPGLPIEFYEEMLRDMKKAFSGVHIHGFSPPEFVEFVAVFEMEGYPTPGIANSHTMPPEVWSAKLEAIMRRLKQAGLDSIPGGGGEIFAEPIRRRIGLGKATATQWLDVMTCAHRLGMFTSATMMFGHIESVADRIDHMHRVRERQDLALRENLPGRYMSFISWPFQRENTPLGRLPEWNAETDGPFPAEDPNHPLYAKRVRMAGASDYLRTQAVSRLFLDNIHSIGSSWVTMGPKIGQMGLFFGANDMGSVMMEENVVSAAGTTYCLDEAFLCHLIRTAGFTPAQRDNTYKLLHTHEGPEAPDLKVADWSTHRVAQLHIEKPPANAQDTPVTLNVTR